MAAPIIRLISIRELKQRCLEVVREVEQTGKPVAITRRARRNLHKRKGPEGALMAARLAERRELRICAISLWEAQMAAARGRLRLQDSFAVWLRAAAAPEAVEIVPIDVRVALALNDLPASLPADPADRLIVAAARAHALPLATHDRTIRRSRATRLWKP